MVGIFENFVKPVMPELILVISAVLFLLIGASKRENTSLWGSQLSLVSLFGAIIVLMSIYPDKQIYAFNHMFISNAFIVFMKILLLLAVCLFFIVHLGTDKGQGTTGRFEFPVIVLLAVVGMMVMLSANDFIVLYIGLELQSLCLYVLAAFDRDDGRSSEAGIKYFVLGALASGILLYGISLIYGFSGTTNFGHLGKLYVLNTFGYSVTIAMLIGFIMVLVGLSFKIAAVPFHMWIPDVYEGSPSIITTFFAAVPKIAVIGLLVRLLIMPFGIMVIQWQQILAVIAGASMVVGALGALGQSNIKRLLAYSSVGHVGYILLGIVTGNSEGIQAVLLYIVIYVTLALGMFTCVLLMQKDGVMQENIYLWGGLSKKKPALAFAIAVFMLSMAGIPPLAGFFAKFYIFTAALDAGFYLLTILAVVTSVVAAYYYLNIIKIIYFDEEALSVGEYLTKETMLITSLAVLFNLFFFISPKSFLAMTLNAAKILFYGL